MQSKNYQIKRTLRSLLFILLLSMAGMTKAQTENITFADDIVKAYCVANWDTNGDGELSYDEAAAVTSLDGVFMFDGDITSFNELQFFTGLISFGEDEFNSCTSLASITIPSAVTSIGSYAFSDCSSLVSITSYTCIPPTMGSYVFDNVPSAVVFNVPCHTAALYEAADGWSDFSNYEEFEYGLCPIIFADDNVKAICVAHWDTTGDGELSYAEAATVTNLGTYFKSTAITSFDELEYFTSLTALPNTAFYGCTSLASIALPSSVSALGNGSFYNCTNLATMTVYAETPPTVGTNAFKNVPTTMIVQVPCGTVEAYQNANGWSGFINIQQSGSCPIVFADANVKALCVANWDTNGDGELSYAEASVVTDLGEVFERKYSITSFDELQYFINLTSIGSWAFFGCSSLTSIVIPNSVNFIGDHAFTNCSCLTSFEIPNSVTTIDYFAFSNCNSLTSIEIPNSVISINDCAFNACTGLTSIEIPNSVISIGTNPFRNCSSLEQVIVDSGNTVYDNRENCNAIIKTSANELVTGCKNTVIPNSVIKIGEAFCGCTGLTSIEIPNSVTIIGPGAFSGCTGLTSIEIPNSVTMIGSSAFSACSGLTSMIIPNSVTTIDNFSFSNCYGLTSIIIPNSVTRLGNYAFSNCNGLTSIEIPNSVVYLLSYVFDGCKNLSFVNIPSSITYIGDCAFRNCSSLTSIILPNSVTSISNSAFSGCTSLDSIVSFAETPPALGSVVFNDVNKTIPVYVPNGTISAYQNTEGWSEFTNYVEICSGTITVVVSPAEGGLITGGGYYESGATCTLTATANEGYTFMYWTENENQVSSNASYSFTVIGDRILVANFALPFTITASANLTEGGTVTGTGSYNYGTTATLTATPNSGYGFLYWTENGEVVSSDAEYTFLVTGDRNLVANFSFLPPAPIVAEYYPDPNEPNSPYVKVHWASTFPFEAQIGEGVSTFGYFPFYTLYNYSISENLFLASELEEAGVNTAPMKSLSWYATNAPGYEQQGISIWMANVSDTELTTTSHTVNDMTLVYTGTMTPEIGWNEFVFNEGTFAWDGTSNVLIFCQRNNEAWNNTVYWQATADLPFNASSYKYQDAGAYDPSVAHSMTISTTRPNIIMKCNAPMTCNIYRANCDGSNIQLVAENLNDLQFIDETWWQLENDSYKYGVSIADSTNTDIFWSNCIEKQGNVAVQTCALSAGINWFSTNVEITLDDLKSALVATGGTNIVIKAKSSSTTWNGHRWLGSLNGFNVNQMYMITVQTACEITLVGMPLSPAEHPVTISNGANWIGYPLNESMTLTEAFSGFPTNQDVVKSKNASATWNGHRWVGQLSNLVPGQGYIYQSKASGNKTLTFPSGAK